MIAYKGFHGDLTCTYGKGTFQYTPGMKFIEDRSKCVSTGLHCAEYILDCLKWYPLGKGNRYFQVEAEGSIDEDGTDSKISCTEMTLVMDLENMNNLEKTVYQMGRENPELFVKLYEAPRADAKTYQEVLAPSGEGMISVRIQGVGRMMLAIKDVDLDVSLVNVRNNEKENFTWEQLADAIRMLTGVNSETRPEDGRKWWEEVYKEEYPIAEKPEVAPVQPSKPELPKARKESKVTAAKPEPPKAKKKPEPAKEISQAKPEMKEPEKAAVPQKPAMPEPQKEAPEPAEQQEHKPEKAEVAPVQPEEPGVAGQMEWTKDFPEYLPEDYVTAEDGTQILPAKQERWTGPRYEVRDVVSDYGLFDRGQLALICLSRRNAMLIKAIMEKEQAAGNMGNYYFTKEDCEKFFAESEG